MKCANYHRVIEIINYYFFILQLLSLLKLLLLLPQSILLFAYRNIINTLV